MGTAKTYAVLGLPTHVETSLAAVPPVIVSSSRYALDLTGQHRETFPLNGIAILVAPVV